MNLQKINEIKRVTYFRKRDLKNGLKLDSNEMVSDWNKSIYRKIHNSIKNYEITSYPKDNYLDLKKKIAKNLGIRINNFLITSGADGAIKEFLTINSYQKKQRKVLILGESYGMYRIYLKIFNYDVKEINYLKDVKKNTFCKLDKFEFYKNIKKNHIIALVNPNHLSNYDFTLKEIITLLKKFPNKKFLIDEAYFGYGCFSLVSHVKNFRNLFIARSFSKQFGLASIRLGCLIAHKDTILPYLNTSQPYITNIYSSKIAEFFLDNYQLIKKKLKREIEGREYLIKLINKNLKNLNIHSSNSMSIFFKFDNKKKRDLIFEKLYFRKIYTRKWDIKFKKDFFYCLRITCGPKKIMHNYFQIFQNILKK